MSDQFASYHDVYGPGGMADDRDDTYDPEFRLESDYCIHGTYIGPPSGADILCGYCEDGIGLAEYREIGRRQRLARIRERASRSEMALSVLLAHGVSGIDAAEFAENLSHVGNPLVRYGRH